MKSDDFFANVDSKLRKISEAEAASNDRSAENREFLELVVARLAPIVSSYKAKLKERNLHAEVQSYPTGISFTIRYKDGGHHGLSIGGSLETNRITMTSSFTNDDGRNYTSTNGATYDKSNWKDELFEEQLQKCIQDFLFYADRHGGV